MSQARIPIRTVAALTGVNPITLRAWERRYGLVRPLRTPKGHRLYTQAHVAEIRRVLALTREGVAIGQVKEALKAEAALPAAKPAAGPWPGWRKRMADAVAAFDEAALEATYGEALAMHPIDEVNRRLLMPLLEDLGARWNKSAGGVAEEHFFSTYLRNKLGARFHHRRPIEDGPKVLAACAPGESHELGLLLFALAAHDAGLRVVMLGANVPFSETAAAARRAQVDAVVLSSSIEPSKPFFGELAGLAAALKRPLFLGGATAANYEQAVHDAGAIPLGAAIEPGAQRIAALLQKNRE